VYGAQPAAQNPGFGSQSYGPPQGYAPQAPYPQQQAYPQQSAQNPAFGGPQPYAQGYPQQQQAYAEPVQEERRPSDKPIDRNGVAPSSVSIEKMFYFGNKK